MSTTSSHAVEALPRTLQLQEMAHPLRRMLLGLVADVVLLLLRITYHLPISIRKLDLVAIVREDVLVIDDWLVLSEVAEVVL